MRTLPLSGGNIKHESRSGKDRELRQIEAAMEIRPIARAYAMADFPMRSGTDG
jgi:hypothetical protein